MKLFITNKKEFEDTFDGIDSRSYSTKIIHQQAYNTLFRSVNINNSIPLVITSNYDEEGVAIFDFHNYKDDVYFYNYTGTAK